jgi:hypothetical protein
MEHSHTLVSDLSKLISTKCDNLSRISRDRGQCYIFGHNSSKTSMWQIITLHSDITSAHVRGESVYFKLSAWLGGWSRQDDNARVQLWFFDNKNQTLNSSVEVGPVFAIDRNGVSLSVYRETIGVVPIRASALSINVTLTRMQSVDNDGCIDNLSLIFYRSLFELSSYPD